MINFICNKKQTNSFLGGTYEKEINSNINDCSNGS